MNTKVVIMLSIFVLWMLLMIQNASAVNDMEPRKQNSFRLSVIFNNIPYQAGLETGWGFACLIEHGNKTVLFDTGANGAILLSNMHRMGLDPLNVDAIILSHIHTDHTGGLATFLSRNPNVTVFMPVSFPLAFQQEVKRLGAKVETVSEPQQLFDSLYSTGEMGEAVKEQALILDTQQGLIVITGCAHPNVADMVERPKVYLDKYVYLLMGGFHLLGSSENEISTVIKRLKAQGVQKVAPSHCTGDKAILMFRDAWGDNFVEGGLGAIIEVPLLPNTPK